MGARVYPFAVPFIAGRWSTSYGGSGGASSYGGDASDATDVVNLTVSAGSVGSAVSRACGGAGGYLRGTAEGWRRGWVNGGIETAPHLSSPSRRAVASVRTRAGSWVTAQGARVTAPGSDWEVE